MIELYHGTSNIDFILEKGKLTTSPPIRNWTSKGKVPTVDSIHLTNSKICADFYGLRSAVVSNRYRYSVLKVEVDENLLYPDENYFSVDGDIQTDEMEKIRISVKKHKNEWKKSLEKCSNATLYEDIPVNKIIGIETKLNKDNFWWFLVEDTFTIDEFDMKHNATRVLTKYGNKIDWNISKLILLEGEYGETPCRFKVVSK